MSKFLHDAAGPNCGDSAERLGIQWPDLPWKCPVCRNHFATHEQTVATLDVTRYEHPGETTFLCIMCDLFTHSASSGGETLQ